MCIPYLYDRARSMSHLVMDASPNLMMVVDEDLKVLECSAAVEKYFGVKPEEMKGRELGGWMETDEVEEVFKTHTSIHSRRALSPERGFVVFQNIAYIPEGNFVILTLMDVTREEALAKQEYEKKKATINLAQKVIYKQMMVAQEIAGLLGETTAETKTTLTKLCSLIEDEKEGEVRTWG